MRPIRSCLCAQCKAKRRRTDKRRAWHSYRQRVRAALRNRQEPPPSMTGGYAA